MVVRDDVCAALRLLRCGVLFRQALEISWGGSDQTFGDTLCDVLQRRQHPRPGAGEGSRVAGYRDIPRPMWDGPQGRQEAGGEWRSDFPRTDAQGGRRLWARRRHREFLAEGKPRREGLAMIEER